MSPAPGKPVVLVVTSTLPRWIGDTEPRFVLELCRALAGDYRIIALAPHCRGAARHEVLDGVEVRRFRYGPAGFEVLAYDGGMLPGLRARPWRWLLVPAFVAALVLAVARLLRRERVDLVHAHWLVPQGLAVRVARSLAGRRVPMVCTAHGTDVVGLRGGVARALQRYVVRGCARVAVVSEALREEFARRGLPGDRVRVLPMGVPDPAPVAGAPARAPGLVAFAGRLIEAKGVAVLLEALRQLQPVRADLRLAVAGDGPERERLRQRAQALGLGDRVEFLGALPRAEIDRLLARAAVAVMPSLTEGLGLVMLEAMAAGCPVVASGLPAVRSVVTDGVQALLVPAGDAAALAQALRRVLEDPALAARLAAAGRELVAARFSWRAAAAGYGTAFAEALAAR